MKKYFFISNRQSGKTKFAIFEFLKEPNNTLLLVHNQRQISNLVNLNVISDKNIDRIVSYDFFIHNLKTNKNIDRLIFDDYLQLDVQTRSELINKIYQYPIQEIICFSTPSVLYDKQVFNFVKETKEKKTSINIESFLSRNELLLELNDLNLRTKNQITNEIWELYYNHLTDPETIIINNKYFYNSRIFNLDNISYFPDVERELTELKSEFLKN